MVADDVFVTQCLDVCKVFLQEEDVLPIECDRLHCKPSTSAALGAVSHHSMRPLAYLLAQRVLILKQRSKPFLLIGI